MEEGGKRRVLRFRVPVSEDYWHRYGIPLGFLSVGLSVAAVVLAREPGDGLFVGLAFLGFSAGAVLVGLAVYNVVVAALIAAKR